jgi:hypothetical protein
MIPLYYDETVGLAFQRFALMKIKLEREMRDLKSCDLKKVRSQDHLRKLALEAVRAGFIPDRSVIFSTHFVRQSDSDQTEFITIWHEENSCMVEYIAGEKTLWTANFGVNYKEPTSIDSYARPHFGDTLIDRDGVHYTVRLSCPSRDVWNFNYKLGIECLSDGSKLMSFNNDGEILVNKLIAKADEMAESELRELQEVKKRDLMILNLNCKLLQLARDSDTIFRQLEEDSTFVRVSRPTAEPKGQCDTAPTASEFFKGCCLERIRKGCFLYVKGVNAVVLPDAIVQEYIECTVNQALTKDGKLTYCISILTTSGWRGFDYATLKDMEPMPFQLNSNFELVPEKGEFRHRVTPEEGFSFSVVQTANPVRAFFY